MQIHELNSRTPTDTDEMALDTGSQTYKTRVGLLKPQFVSYDRANPTSWENVPLITGNSSIVFVFERLTRMFGNIRYLWKLIGSGDFSNVSETISGAIGNTALTTTATSLSGAIAEHEGDISDINDEINTINGNLTYKQLSPTFDESITNPATILAYQIGHIVFIRFWGTVFSSAINKDCIFGMPKSVMQSTGSLALAGANSNTLVGNAYNTSLESTSIHVTLNSSAYGGAYNTYGYFCYLTSEDP